MVDDLAAALLAVAAGTARTVFEVDDGVPVTHRQYAAAIGRALGRRVLAVPLPAPVLRAGGRLDRLVRGRHARLTPDRARYLAHRDWTVDPAKRPPPALWSPQIGLDEGMAATVSWYRARGLL